MLRGHAQLAMGFVSVVVQSQSVDMGVGDFDLRDLFTGKIRGKSSLPELVLALNFPLGLRRWGIQEANVVKLESPAQLGQRVRILRERRFPNCTEVPSCPLILAEPLRLSPPAQQMGSCDVRCRCV